MWFQRSHLKKKYFLQHDNICYMFNQQSLRLNENSKTRLAILKPKSPTDHHLSSSSLLLHRSLTFITELSLYFTCSFNLKSIKCAFRIYSKLKNQEKQLENKLKNFVVFYLPKAVYDGLMIWPMVCLFFPCSWITALKMSIKKWLPLDQAIQEFMNRPLEETRMWKKL